MKKVKIKISNHENINIIHSDEIIPFEVILAEMGLDSILITESEHGPQYQFLKDLASKISGIQFDSLNWTEDTISYPEEYK